MSNEPPDNFRRIPTIVGLAYLAFSVTSWLAYNAPDISWLHWAAGTTATLVFQISLFLMVVSFVALLAILAGRYAGKKTIGAQALHTFGRVFLLILLPALLLTVGLILSSIFFDWPPSTMD